MRKHKQLLAGDDDPGMPETVTNILVAYGCGVTTASNVARIREINVAVMYSLQQIVFEGLQE